VPPLYVELRAHTAFSFGDGSITPERLVHDAKERGYAALGITDTADLGAIPRFAAHARKAGIRPIVGAELNVDGTPMAFLARTAEGYCHLAGLVTAARVGCWRSWEKERAGLVRGYPNVTWAQVAERSAGLHLLTGPASGALATLVRQGAPDRAERLLHEWRDVFGAHLAVEVQRHYVGGAEAALAAALIALAERAGVPWVVTHDPRYVDDASRLVHDMLTALRHEMDIDAAARAGVLHPNGDWRLLAVAEMAQRWRGREDGLDESARIAETCDFDLGWMRPPMPVFEVPEGYANDDEYLRARVMDGAHRRWGDRLTPKQQEQLDHELRLIKKLGFSGFFLVMYDGVSFAQRQGILCQGRGSAANSAVAYCLGITAVDPIKEGLLFERFLSEARVHPKPGDASASSRQAQAQAVDLSLDFAPDIDVDFEHDRREEVLDYMYANYERPHAAIAAIVQTYRAPNAVRDAMRALGYPPALADCLSKRVHNYEPSDGAEEIREAHAKHCGVDVEDRRGKTLLAAIAAFDGLPRLRGTHVGGFVLSSAPLGNYLPIEQTTMGRTIVQFDKDDLDILGVPKFDFLGLGGLALVKRAFDAIAPRIGKPLTMYGLPTDDERTYEMISRGDTVGTFQIESRAQIASIVHTKPEKLYDIVVQVALIRPGPIQARFVRPYTERRRGRAALQYYSEELRPRLEPILGRTQGIPIFQEQAMAIAIELAGYSGADADALRRTMGHQRKRQRLDAALAELHERMLGKGITPAIAEQICEDFKSFSNYGFPESHAWSFAYIAYATSYLKAHYPTEFYLGLLNAWPMGFYSPATLIHDARRHEVEVRPPCLRDGDWECTVEPGAHPPADDPDRPALRIGWRFVHGMGEKSLDKLREARALGRFTSIADVVLRARLTRAEVIFLALAGAFAAWEPDRHRAAWEALRAVGDALPLAPAHRAAYEPAPLGTAETIFLDYAAVGISLAGHPMQTIRERLRAGGALDSRELEQADDGRTVTVGGLVTIRQRPQTAKGTIFLLLEDEYGFMNIIVSRDLAVKYGEIVRHAPFVLVQGKLQKEGAAINIVGRRFKALEAGELEYRSRDFH
jgi:error-prone DNA polymerase